MNQAIKSDLHPRNKHRSRYDFKKLSESLPELSAFVRLNDYNDESIDFANPDAVKALNKAILKSFYHIQYWDIPKNYLCPPIPGRADYIHNLADLFSDQKNLKGLDIGVGANCVYPLIGNAEYGWSFVGADVDPVSVESAENIIKKNYLEEKIEIRKQLNADFIFKGIIKENDSFDFTLCNPPFHTSLEEAMMGSKRKWKNLGKSHSAKPVLNFGGQGAELWCKGGESRFIKTMIQESVLFSKNCHWFTTLVSKKENLDGIYRELKKVKAVEVKTIEMGQGQKKSRMVAWSFRSLK